VYITEINSTEEQLVDALKELLIMKDTIATLENEQKMFKEKSRLINVNRSNNEKTKFYTGLNSWNIFFAVFELYLPGMESITTAITAQGTISYISQGYGGLSSDVFITEDSKHIVVPEDQNFLTKLLPHDVVLADRGFLIAESVAMMGAELVTPAFKGLRPRITQLEVEQSRRISNVRIHVERVIGQLRKSFNILQENLNVYEVQLDADGLAFIDKIAFLLWIIARNR
jgi:hypothetical protein